MCNDAQNFQEITFVIATLFRVRPILTDDEIEGKKMKRKKEMKKKKGEGELGKALVGRQDAT